MLDADLFARSDSNPNRPYPPDPDHPGRPGGDEKLRIKLRDWAPFLVASFGMLVINTVDKSVLAAHSISFIHHHNAAASHTHHANTLNPPTTTTTSNALPTTHHVATTSTSFSGEEWQARVILFLGFTCLFLGLAGSVLGLVFKYVLPGVEMPALGMGVLGVVGSACVAVSGGVLWGAQNMEDEYSYSLQL